MSDAIMFSGVTLDCPDARRLANFYAAVTGGTVSFSDDSWATVDVAGGRLEFQTVPNHQPPRWPDPTASIQLHLDFYVEDRPRSEARVLAAGATKYNFQPNGHCTVFADPAGHAFCLSTWGKPDWVQTVNGDPDPAGWDNGASGQPDHQPLVDGG